MSAPAPPDAATPAVALLAAGRGSRARCRSPKALLPLLGKPLLAHHLRLVQDLSLPSPVVVTPPQISFPAAVGIEGTTIVPQAAPGGTAEALELALPALRPEATAVLVLYAASSLLNEELVRRFLNRWREGHLDALALQPQPKEGEEARACGFLFRIEALRAAIEQSNAVPGGDERDLAPLLTRISRAGGRVELFPVRRAEDAVWIRDRVELAEAAAVLRTRILRTHMLDGVTIEDPASTFVESDVEIGRDTVLRPHTHLCGRTRVGEHCEVGPSVRVTDSVLGDRVSVQFAVVTESEVGDDSRIGPFAQLRPGCRVGVRAKVGNFVELKNAVLGAGVSAGHLAYLGDVEIGERANIGAGTITCNYDGAVKHPTHIGARAFIGSHTTLVAPVAVGDGAFTAAGTVVTESVPRDALAIGRSRQSNKLDWARRRRDRAQEAD